MFRSPSIVIELAMPRAFERMTEPSARSRGRSVAAGFTLVEMIAVMAVTGIIAAAVAVFLRMPLQSYQDAQRRASITDAADTAFMLIKRELQTALPNSVRVRTDGAVFSLEFLQIRTAGRYRAEDPAVAVATSANTCPDASGDGLAGENVLEFGVADTCFATLGALPNLAAIAPSNDFVVVYNLGPGYSEANAYASANATGGNKSLVTASAAGNGNENVIRFQSHTFTLASPGRRFHVIAGAVSYVCDPAAGTLRRVSGYPISAGQPAPVAGNGALLAQGVTACTLAYDQNAINVVNQRMGVVSIWLGFTEPAGGAALNLFQQVQVSNVP